MKYVCFKKMKKKKEEQEKNVTCVHANVCPHLPYTILGSPKKAEQYLFAVKNIAASMLLFLFKRPAVFLYLSLFILKELDFQIYL